MEYWIIFLTGFLGSLHCLGMCGPIVAAYSTYAARNGGSTMTAGVPFHAAYNAGRLFSYTALGFVAGALGGMLASVRGAAPLLTTLLGSAMVAVGVSMLFLRYRRGTPAAGQRFSRMRSSLFARLLRGGTHEAAFLLGALTPLLPCGMFSAMFLRASAAGHPLAGGFVMLSFVTGTIPAMALAGFASTVWGIRFRRYADRAAAVMIILMGVFLLLKAARHFSSIPEAFSFRIAHSERASFIGRIETPPFLRYINQLTVDS